MQPACIVLDSRNPSPETLESLRQQLLRLILKSEAARNQRGPAAVDRSVPAEPHSRDMVGLRE